MKQSRWTGARRAIAGVGLLGALFLGSLAAGGIVRPATPSVPQAGNPALVRTVADWADPIDGDGHAEHQAAGPARVRAVADWADPIDGRGEHERNWADPIDGDPSGPHHDDNGGQGGGGEG